MNLLKLISIIILSGFSSMTLADEVDPEGRLKTRKTKSVVFVLNVVDKVKYPTYVRDGFMGERSQTVTYGWSQTGINGRFNLLDLDSTNTPTTLQSERLTVWEDSFAPYYLRFNESKINAKTLLKEDLESGSKIVEYKIRRIGINPMKLVKDDGSFDMVRGRAMVWRIGDSVGDIWLLETNLQSGQGIFVPAGWRYKVEVEPLVEEHESYYLEGYTEMLDYRD